MCEPTSCPMTLCVTIWLRVFCLNSSYEIPCASAAFSNSSIVVRFICFRISSRRLISSVSPVMPRSLPFCKRSCWSIRSRRTSRCFSATIRSALSAFCCCASCLSWSRLWAYSVRVMISLLTRAIISSTTVSAGVSAGNNIAPATANSKGSVVFFMLGLTKPGQNPES